MATIVAQTGSFNISTHNPYISGYVQWRETYDDSTYIATNKTKVEMRAYLHRTNIYDGATYITNTPVTRIMHFGDEQLSDESSVSFSIPGNTSASGGEYIAVYSALKEITHNADGSKSLNLGFHMWNTESGVAGDSFRVPTVRHTVQLITIPRASTFGTITGNTIGGSCTVNITRANSSFTHQLWYKVGNSGWYDLGKGIGTSKTFTIDEATANQFTTTSSGTMQLCVRTFNGTTQVGSDVYKDVTVYVPDYTPDATSGVEIWGNKLFNGEYVEGKSTLTVWIDATTDYGASIVSYSSTIDGKTYSGYTFTTDTLSSGSHRVTTTIKDSRGKTKTIYSDTIYVESYSSPQILSVSVKRDETTPSTVVVSVSGIVSPINNKNTMKVEVTLAGVTKTLSTSGYTFNNSVTFTSVDSENSYTATVTLTDAYTSVSSDGVVSTIAVTMDFYNTGKGIAIGKVAEKNGLEVDWESWFNKGSFHNGIGFIDGDRNKLGAMMMGNGELFFSKTGEMFPNLIIHAGNIRSFLTSAIAENKDVEYGTSGVWTYRKSNDGTAECWCTYTHETAVSKSWGSMYYSDSLTPRINYPFTFTDRPIENVTFKGETSAGWLYTEGGGFSLNSTTQSGQYGVCRPTSIGSSKLVFDYYVIGKWK
jgi:hypothetical protein